MAAIKLGRLPDRTPVKITIAMAPELARALNDYSDYYASCYGKAESVSELIPAILEAFLNGDREFVRARKPKGGAK